MAIETVRRCWVVSYLLLAFIPTLFARPPLPDEPMIMRFCGRDLTRAIDEVCVAVKSPAAAFIDRPALNQTSSDGESVDNGLTKPTKLDDKKSDSLLRQCCVIGCTEDDLATFCRADRNQVIGAAMHLRGQEWDNDWLYEFLPRYGAALP